MMGKVPVGSRPSEDGGGRQGCLERSLRLRFVIACLSLDRTYGRIMEDVFCDTIISNGKFDNTCLLLSFLFLFFIFLAKLSCLLLEDDDICYNS